MEGYRHIFGAGRMTVGLVVPIEPYPTSPVPAMRRHLERAKLAEALGFRAVWLRDVPFHVPSFGDAGSIYDPFVYLGYLAAGTETIALGVASVILSLRHPAHVAKAALSADHLSGGRLVLGVASGDRAQEYPALGISYEARGARFRDSFAYIEAMQAGTVLSGNVFGEVGAELEMLPRPIAGKIPMLPTGGSQQSPEWLAQHGDGWMTYPRDPRSQRQVLRAWRARTRDHGREPKPAMQPLYIDVTVEDAGPRPIHLGIRSGISYLREHLLALEDAGVDHVALNLRFQQTNVEATLELLAEEILPHFHGPHT